MNRLNWSTLKYMAVSPALLQHRVKNPRPDTAALRLGRAIHCRIFEPEVFPTRWITAGPCEGMKKPKKKGDAPEVCGSGGSLYLEGSWFCKVRGHAPEGAGDPPKGIEVLDPDDQKLAEVCGANVLAHPLAAKTLAGGKFEEAIEWTDPSTEIACRGRLDCLQPYEVIDLKSTRRETAREFCTDFARNLNHGQIAWYHDGAIAAGLIPPDAPNPEVIMVSNVEPHDVAVLVVTEATLEAGRNLYRDLIRKYAECQAAEYWPGIGPDLLGLDLPTWAEGMRVPELEEW